MNRGRIGGYALAAGAWLSTGALCWLMILERVKMWPASLFLVFFLIVAVPVSAALWSPRGKDDKG